MRHIVKSKQLSQKEKKKSSLKGLFAKGFVQIPNLEFLINLCLPAYPRVLCYLKMKMIDKDSCFPEQKTIAEDLGLSRPSVERAIARAKKERFVRVFRQGQKQSNTYVARVRFKKFFRMKQNKQVPSIISDGSHPSKVMDRRTEEDSSKKIEEKNGIRINDDASAKEIITGNSLKKYGTETITITRNLPALVEMYRKIEEKKRFPYAPRPGF